MPNPETPITVESALFDDEFNRWLTELEREIETTKQSEQLTAEDYQITINAR